MAKRKITYEQMLEIQRLHAQGYTSAQLITLTGLDKSIISRAIHGKYKFGRPSQQGEKHFKAKLTSEQVKEIRELYATGEYTQCQLAERFGVSQDNISHIIRRAGWDYEGI